MNAYLEMVLDTVVQHEVTDKQISSIVDRIAKSCGAKLCRSESRHRYYQG